MKHYIVRYVRFLGGCFYEQQFDVIHASVDIRNKLLSDKHVRDKHYAIRLRAPLTVRCPKGASTLLKYLFVITYRRNMGWQPY